jgi:hypothetical protein
VDAGKPVVLANLPDDREIPAVIPPAHQRDIHERNRHPMFQPLTDEASPQADEHRAGQARVQKQERQKAPGIAFEDSLESKGTPLTVSNGESRSWATARTSLPGELSDSRRRG